MRNDSNTLDTDVVVPLKYLSNFQRSLDLPLINCEIKLDLSWSKECVIAEMPITPALSGNPDPNLPVPDVTAIQGVSARFQINNAKLYVPVVTLSFNDNIGFLEKIKQRFKRRIY